MASQTSKTTQYLVTLTGKSALIMHKDNIRFTEYVNKWRKDPQNSKISIAGDDRSPAFTWMGYLYTDMDMEKKSTKVVIDSDCIMTMLREAGAKTPTGKGKQTFKSITQTGLQVQGNFKFFNNGKEIETDWINDLRSDNDFEKHIRAVEEHGFILNMKRAKIGSGPRASKHVRIRPQFDNWSAQGVIQVGDEETSGIKKDVLERLFQIAGDLIGLCDWRPSSPNPGPYGRFNVEVKEI